MSIYDPSKDPPTNLQALSDAIEGLLGIRREIVFGEGNSQSASFTRFLPVPGDTVEVLAITLQSSVSTSSEAGVIEWKFNLYNVTQDVALFSEQPGTATVVPGIGGGEIVAQTPYTLVPDQNQVVVPGDVIELRITKVGAATTLSRWTVQVDWRGVA